MLTETIQSTISPIVALKVGHLGEQLIVTLDTDDDELEELEDEELDEEELEELEKEDDELDEEELEELDDEEFDELEEEDELELILTITLFVSVLPEAFEQVRVKVVAAFIVAVPSEPETGSLVLNKEFEGSLHREFPPDPVQVSALDTVQESVDLKLVLLFTGLGNASNCSITTGRGPELELEELELEDISPTFSK